MAANLVTKLGVDPSKYISGMDEARKSLDKFQKQNMSTKAAMKEVTSVLTKYVSVAALVKGAQEVVTRTIQGSQKSMDNWTATIDGCKNAVDTFFTALSKGNFSSFTQGLDNIVAKGREASMAIDQLGNTIMSVNYLTSSNNAAFAQALLTIRDTKATPAEREAANRMADQELEFMKDLNAGRRTALEKAITAVSTKKSPLSANQFRLQDIEAISLLDAFAEKPELLAKYGLQSKDFYLSQAAEYAALIQAARPSYETYDYNKARSLQGQQEIAAINARNAQLRETFKAYEADLQQQYLFALEVQALLEDIKDKELQDIFNLNQQIADGEMQVTNMTKQLATARGELKRGIGTNDGSVEPVIRGGYTGATPGMAGLTVPEATMTISDKLPKIDTSLQGINGTLVQMQSNIDSVTNSADRMSQTFESFNSIGRSIEYLGNAFSNLEKNGWKVAGGIVSTAGAVVQAYTQMAQAAAMAAATEGMAETPTVLGKLAAAAALVTAIGTSFAQIVGIVNSTSFADGGIIPGQNYNDGITARVSSGEMIINQADQKRLFDSIHSGGVGGGSVRSSISGEQIVIAVNNYARRTNRGELVFAGKG